MCRADIQCRRHVRLTLHARHLAFLPRHLCPDLEFAISQVSRKFQGHDQNHFIVIDILLYVEGLVFLVPRPANFPGGHTRG